MLAGAALNRFGSTIRLPCAPVGTGRGPIDGTLFIAWDDNFPADLWPGGYKFVISSSPGSHTIINGADIDVKFGEEILGGLDYTGDGNAKLFVGDLTGDGGNGFNSGLGYVFYHAANLRNLVFDLQSPPEGVEFTVILGPLPGTISSDTVAHGDFDGDGRNDLVIGNPHDNPFGRIGTGSRHILYGPAVRGPG